MKIGKFKKPESSTRASGQPDSGIYSAFLQNESILTRAVADMVVQHPDRFTGIGSVSLENFTIKRALKPIEDCVELGMIGLSIEPAFFNMTLDEKKLYPIYAKAMENNLLVVLHTGINYTPTSLWLVRTPFC